ncbi:MAG: tetratricopeptide repeat protein [Acidobacteria bacterium]|nr:tetratricopeptide repeat protein [Acidobacteriota bacterium]
MRTLIFSFSLGLSLLISACGSTEPASRSNQNSGAADNTSRAEKPVGNTSREVGVSSSHGGGGGGASTTAAPAAGGDADKSLANTAEYDARIVKASAKADAPGASETDKKTAAEAYLARANVYRDAGNPKLYKFALGDYRRVLRYQPDNREAKEKMDEIVSIYEGLGRPVPTNGLEP